MSGMEGPEGQLHAHDYRIDVVVERREVDAQGMVADIDVLDAAVGAVVDRLREQDLAEHIPFGDAAGVTVEAFARWLHDILAEPVNAAGGESLGVRVWESDVACGGYRGAV